MLNHIVAEEMIHDEERMQQLDALMEQANDKWVRLTGLSRMHPSRIIAYLGYTEQVSGPEYVAMQLRWHVI